MEKTKKCKSCGKEIPKNAKFCNDCGTRFKKPIYTRWWFWVCIVIIAIFVIIPGESGEPSTAPKTTPSTSISSTAKPTAPEKTPEPATPEPDDSVPSEFKSALRKAKDYDKLMHMSKDALYDQLVSEYGEKFSEDAAQYAIDNLDADWNENALAKAEEYSKTMHMSKAGIYDQLTSDYGEKFTPEQAQYAVDNLDTDWNENALAKAKSYRDTMNMSPAAIWDQLVSDYGEKFTP